MAIRIDPQVLMLQSAEMLSLTGNYDRLFQSVTASLNTMNTRWSANLSNNFAPKIVSAGASFGMLEDLLTAGAHSAKESAEQFLSIDQSFDSLKSVFSKRKKSGYQRKSKPLPNGDETGESVSLYDLFFGKKKKKTITIKASDGYDLDAEQEAYRKREAQYRREHSVVVHEDSSIPNQFWNEIKPHKTNSEGYRYPEAYEEVLHDLQVESRKRYARDRDTYCNIYVWDATKAMNCEIPHYYNPVTGEGFTQEEAERAGWYSSSNPNGFDAMNANKMTEWLEKFGAKNGWIECDEKTAIERANGGYPTVVAATNTNHVGMVVPQHEGETGVMISQAGALNYEHGPLNRGFYKCEVKYYYHA